MQQGVDLMTDKDVRYRIIIECDNEWIRMEWWSALDAYITLLETVRMDMFDNDSWSIKKDVVEE